MLSRISPDMIFVKEAAGPPFCAVQQAGEELLGYSREELCGKNDYDSSRKPKLTFSRQRTGRLTNTGRFWRSPKRRSGHRLKGERILLTKKFTIPDVAWKTRVPYGDIGGYHRTETDGECIAAGPYTRSTC
jgi:PAS domain-containing protein